MRGDAHPGWATTIVVAHPSSGLYGSDRMLLEAVAGMLERGWRVLVTLPSPGPLVAELQARGATVRICRAPVVRTSARSLGGLLRLGRDVLSGIAPGWRLLRRERPDLVYVSTLVSPLWLVLARLLRISAVCHVHEAERHLPRRLRTLLASPLLLAHGVVANSRFTQQVLRESLSALDGRIVVVPNGVAAPSRPAPPRPVLQAPVRLLCVGRLSPRKGTDIAVRAAAALVHDGIEVQLELVGDTFTGYEWFERQVRDLVHELGLDGKVTFHGFQPDVWQHLAAADVVVVPSRLDESFGNAAVEAIVSRRPVVVSDLAGLREATENQGAVRRFPVGDDAGLAEQIRDLVDSWSAVVRVLDDPMSVSVARFAPERYRADVVSVLESVLARRRSAGPEHVA